LPLYGNFRRAYTGSRALKRRDNLVVSRGTSVDQVHTVELGSLQNAPDGRNVAVDVRLQGSPIICTGGLRRQHLALDLVKSLADVLDGRASGRDGRVGGIQAGRNGLDGAGIGLHRFCDGPDGSIILGRADRLSGRNFTLRLAQPRVDGLERLQRDHGRVVGQNAGHVFNSIKWGFFPCSDDGLLTGGNFPVPLSTSRVYPTGVNKA